MKISIITISILLFFNSCDRQQKETDETEEHQPEPAGNQVFITEQQMRTAGIEMDTLQLKNLKSSIKSNGLLTVPNQNKAFITSVNNGIIKTLLIHPGIFVRKGQAVATIVNPGVADLQQQYQIINAQINLAEIEFQRQRELVEGNAAPLKNVQKIQTELTTLKATRNSLEKQLNAMGISAAGVRNGNIVTTLTIVAPISGTVSNVAAQIGSNIDPSTPIAEIVNNSQLHLDLFVFEKDLPELHVNQVIHCTLTNNPGKEYDAQIYSIGTAFTKETKTIPVHAIVKGDKSGLIEGMNITALISIGTMVVPAVPTEAIINNQGQDYIFVLLKKGTSNGQEEVQGQQGKSEGREAGNGVLFERVQVIKGATDIGFTEVSIIKDLPVNAQVVTKGAFFVLAKMINTGGH